MNRKGYFGKKGEEKACRFLEERGFVVFERNFRCRTGEVDVIAMKYGVIHFVEVKTRSSVDYGFPAESVTRDKQRKLLLAARYYITTHREFSGMKYVMDVIEVLVRDDTYYVRFIENAFGEVDL